MTSPSIPPDDGMNDLRGSIAGVYQDPATPTTPPVVAKTEGVDYWQGIIRANQAREFEQWGTSMRAAIETNPETAGLADTLARKMGMPLLKAQKDAGFLRAVAIMQQMRDDDIRSTNPVLYKSFQGLEFARKSWDDYGGLSWGESWARGWKSGALTAERGRLAVNLWLSGGLELDKETGKFKRNASDRMQRRQDLDRLEALEVEQRELGPIGGFIGNAAKIAGQWGDAVPRAIESGYKTAAVTGSASLLAGPAAPVAVAPATVTGFFLGAGAQYTADTFSVMAGNAYADMIAANYDPDRALAASVGVGIVGTALELTGLGFVTSAVRQRIMGAVWKRAASEVAKDVPGGFVRGYLTEYGKVIGAETGTELAQEFALIIAEQLARRGGEDDMNPDGVASRLWEVASSTVQGMALLGIPGGVAGGFRGRAEAFARAEQQRSQAQRDHLKAAQGINPKMLERDPEAAADFMRQALRQGDGPQEAHLDAETFRTLLDKIDTEGAKSGVLRKSTLDVLEGIVPGISKQLEDAEATGGDVSLPVADIITRIRGELPEFELAFSEVARLDPQAPDAEQQASQDTEKAASEADTGSKDEAAFYTSLKEIERQTAASVGQAAGTRISPSQAQAVARTYAAMVEQVAREEKLDPQEAVDRYGIKEWLSAEGIPGDALSQPSLKTDTPKFKAWFGESKVVDKDGAAPQTLFRGTKQRNPESFRGLVFFTDTRSTADAYARSRSGADIQSESYWSRGKDTLDKDVEGRVTEAYVAIQNPLDLRTSAGIKVLADLRIDEEVAFEAAEADALRDTVNAMQSAESVKKRAKAILGGNGDAWELTTKAWTPAWELAIVPALKRLGYDGLVLNDAVDTPGTTWAAFDPTQIKSVNNRGTFDPNDPNILRQPGRGGFDIKRMVAMFTSGADVSTVLHELTHWFVEVVERLDAAGSGYGKAQMDNLLAHWKMTREQWAAMDLEQRRPLLEDIAYNAEEYFASGQAPSAELRGVFQKLRSFIVGVYGAVRNYLVGAYAEETGGAQLRAISPELRSFFDRMLASDAAIEIETATRAGAARLSDTAAKALGIDAETLADIRAKEAEAVEDAKAALTAEAVRGGRFFAAGRRNAEASVKRKLADSLARIRKEVEESMADSPVQAAFQYLRDGLVDMPDGRREFDQSARKLDAVSVRSTLGLPTVKGGERGKSMVARIRELGGIRMDGYPGDLRGEHKIPGVFRKNGGESWERIAQQLASEGYGGEVYDSDVAQSVDNTWLVDALGNAAQGEAIYPSEFVSDSQRMQSEYEAWLQSKGPQEDAAVRASRADMAEREKLYLKLARRRLLERSKESQLQDAYDKASASLGGRKLTAEERKAIREQTETRQGVAPDDVAPLFSFGSGEQMLRALAEAPLREEAIRRQTMQRLEAEEPLANPKEFKRAVEEALHGKTAARLISTILKAVLPGQATLADLEAGAREAARIAIARTPVGKISVRGFAQAELRAAKARDKAIKSGDRGAIIEATRRQLVQHYLTLEAAKAEREIDRETATIAKRFEQPQDKLKQGRNLDIVQVAIAALGKWGMISPARYNAAVDYLAEWRNLDADGFQPYGVRLGILSENAVPMEQMTLDQFRVLVEAASGLWSEAKRSEQVMVAGKLVAKKQAQEELLEELVDTFGQEDGKLPNFRPEEMHDWSVGAIVANLTRLEAWTRKMDGGEPGAWHRYVYLPLKDATVANELEKVAQHAWAKDVMARHDAIKPLAGKEIDLSAVLGKGESSVFKTRAHLIGALYHMGTEKGRRNFLLGNKVGTQPMPGATYDEMYAAAWVRWQQALQLAVDRGDLTEGDFKLVQEVHDHISATLKDRLFETTRDVWGFYPTEERASSWQTPFGTLRGGYFPSKVDKTKSDIGTNKQLSAIQQGAQDFRDAHANVPRGVTIKRGDNVVQPRIIDMRLLTQHIDEALNIIHLQPALSDVAGLFKGNSRSNEQLGMLRDAMGQVAPFAERKIILPALDRMARDSIVAPSDKAIAKAVQYFKQAASMVFLGFNPKNAALQFTGLANAVPEVGMGNLWGAFWTHWHSPSTLVASIEARRPAMKARWSSELQLLAQDMDRMLEPSRLNDARKMAAQAAFYLQRQAQMFVDSIVWQAANDKATAEGLSAEEAGNRADSAVRITQGEKTPLDVPAFLSGNAIAQLFTQFADYPNTVLNQNLAAPDGKRFAVFAWTVLAPAFATSLIGMTMAFGKIGKGERDDEDYAKQVLTYFLGDQVRGGFGLLPIAGPLIGSALNELFGLTNTPGGMRNAPFAAWSIVETLARVGSGRGNWADWVTAAGLVARAPIRPAANVVRFETNVAAGREDYDGALDYLRVILTGK